MPMRPRKPCAWPGCGRLTFERHCETHQAAAKVQRRDRDRLRASSGQRGYDSNWRKLRLMVLRAEPLCRACAAEGRVTEAEHVDHIVPLSRGGTNHRENLQPLCQSCHSRKTATQDGGFGAKRGRGRLNLKTAARL